MMATLAFDFESKECESIAPDDIAERRTAGQFCWLNIDGADFDATAHWLESLGVDAHITQRISTDEQVGHFNVGRSCIHFTVVDVHFTAGKFSLVALHVVLGNNFLVTTISGHSPALQGMLTTAEADFRESAQSAGFLLFELADHLIDSYRATLSRLADQVKDVQASLLGDADDSILARVSALTRSLLDYRKSVVAAREIIHELGTRRSPFVQSSTQPFLEKQTLPLERLATDAATERTVLSESLSLYMGIVSHRTNRVVNRLTIVSMIFLPLSFLAALYGMNFEHMPELKWAYGYGAFWIASLTLVVALIGFMRYKRWI
ncbi:MAG: magnesium transporter CorA family protein [Chromatiales bacterium]|nr:magnesium transporter CorA family protein [Chromatiales bacterium]